MSITDIKEAILQEFDSDRKIGILSQVSKRFDDYTMRCDFLKQLGLEQIQDKMVFILKREEKYSELDKNELDFIDGNQFNFDELKQLMVQVFSDTIDREDIYQIKEKGIGEFVQSFMDEVNENFNFRKEWWRIAIYENKRVGFVLPVSFKDCDKNSLIEGSIYHIGVLPEFRGNGFGLELLHKSCKLFDEIGTWRIFCDTDTENIPMIKAFKRIGFREVDIITRFHN